MNAPPSTASISPHLQRTTAIAIALSLYGCGNGASTTTPPPDALAQARPIARDYIAATPPERQPWDWSSFVFQFGLQRLAAADNTVDGRTYLASFLGTRRDTPPDIISNDTLSPVTSSLYVCSDDGGTGAFCDNAVVKKANQWVTVDAPRIAGGGLVHLGADPAHANQIWIDGLLMAGSYLQERGRLTGTASWWTDLGNQYRQFDDLLRDPATGLHHHGWDAGKKMLLDGADAFWGRGNGWFVAGLAEFLGTLPKTDAAWNDLAARWISAAKAIRPLQRTDGFFNTLLNDPNSYRESSCTALIAFGYYRAVRAGVITDKTDRDALLAAAELAMKGLDAAIVEQAPDHIVPEVSFGTVPGTADQYRKVPVLPNLPWGVGAYLAAASERAAYLKTLPATP